jgi:calcineurin-like phosphoesterase family protein
MKIFLTSDWHLGHGLFIKDRLRPYATIEDMDNSIIDNVNSRVDKNDLLIIAGDVCWRNPEKYMPMIRCKNKILVSGNHDKHFSVTRLSKLFRVVTDAHMLRIPNEPERHIYTTHCAHLVWPYSHYGSLHAFGHSHGRLKNSRPGSYDVGVDNNNMQVLELYEFIELARATKNAVPDTYCD